MTTGIYAVTLLDMSRQDRKNVTVRTKSGDMFTGQVFRYNHAFVILEDAVRVRYTVALTDIESIRRDAW